MPILLIKFQKANHMEFYVGTCDLGLTLIFRIVPYKRFLELVDRARVHGCQTCAKPDFSTEAARVFANKLVIFDVLSVGCHIIERWCG